MHCLSATTTFRTSSKLKEKPNCIVVDSKGAPFRSQCINKITLKVSLDSVFTSFFSISFSGNWLCSSFPLPSCSRAPTIVTLLHHSFFTPQHIPFYAPIPLDSTPYPPRHVLDSIHYIGLWCAFHFPPPTFPGLERRLWDYFHWPFYLPLV